MTVADCPKSLRSDKVKFYTNISSGKMYASESEGNEGGQATWKTKRGRSLALAVSSRYSSCLTIGFVKKGVLGEDTAAFAVMWFKDIVDEEETELELPIWKGDVKRASACCLDDCGERVGTLKLKVTFWTGLVSFDGGRQS